MYLQSKTDRGKNRQQLFGLNLFCCCCCLLLKYKTLSLITDFHIMDGTLLTKMPLYDNRPL